MYLQYGCGFHAPIEWINFDASLTLRIERLPILGRFVRKNAERFPENIYFGDITKGPLVDPASCDGVFCSHVLEHLSLDEATLALRNTLTMLKPGGVFRIVVPDLRAIAERYFRLPSVTSAHLFMTESGLGRSQSPSGLLARAISAFGRSSHLWMWDRESLCQALCETGFDSVRACHFGDSPDAMFKLVELEHRFKDAVALECRRPMS
jgi:hypothetical protein